MTFRRQLIGHYLYFYVYFIYINQFYTPLFPHDLRLH